MSIPASFDYHTASTVPEAIELLQRYGDDAKLLAGGHSLLPMMKLRLAQPEHIIDIGTIPGLAYVRQEQDAIAIGALTTYTTIVQSDVLRQQYPLLVEGCEEVGDRQVRNRGTIGGSIAHADPAGDLPGILLALKATIVMQGPEGIRSQAIDDFLQDAFTTQLEPDEIITEIRLPVLPQRTGTAYLKLANRASHYAITGCAAVITVDEQNICTDASIAITGAGAQTTRARQAEVEVKGKQLDAGRIQAAAELAPEDLEVIADIHGSAEYRRAMTKVIVRRTLLQAVARV